MDDVAAIELIFTFIQFTYQALSWAAMMVPVALMFLYDLTPGTWPAEYRFGAIGIMTGIAFGGLYVLRR